MFTLVNNYHNSAIRIRHAEISQAAARWIRHTLCPCWDCTCGDWPLGTRGPQEVRIEGHRNGGATLYKH